MSLIENKTIKAGMWYTIANFAVKGAAFLSTPIILRLVSQECYGMYVNFNSWLSILMILATGYLFNSILCAQFEYPNCLKEYISTITILSTGIVCVFWFFGFLFSNRIQNFLGMDMKYVHLMFQYLLVDAAYQNLITYDRMRLSYKRVVVFTAGLVVTPLVGSILCAYYFEDKLDGLLLGKIIPMLVICGGIYVYLIVQGRGKFSVEYCKYALKISLPYIPHALSSMLLITADRIIIQQLCGPVEVARYNVVYTCAMVVSLVYNAVSQAWAPWLLQKLDKKEYHDIRVNAKPYFLFFVIFAVLAMLIAPELVWIIGGEMYKDTVNIIPPIMVGIVIQYYYSYFVNIEFYHKKTIWISINTIMATAVNIILNYLLIPIWGITAAAYTTLFGYLCLLLFHYFGARKLKLADIYDNKWHVAILLLYFIMMFLSIFVLYRVIVLRFFLMIAIMLATFFGFKDKVKDIIASRKPG